MMQKKHIVNALCVLILFFICTSLSFAAVTSPEQYLGYNPGDDFHLATYEQLAAYFERLASETNRLQVLDMGLTSEGRRMKFAVITSSENMANLDQYREISKKLSLVHGVSLAKAKELAARGKVIVWIDSGMHSSETSPPMHQFELAYDLVTETDQKTEWIRKNVILLLAIANPDGMTIVANWYQQHIGTPYEVSSLPVLYNKYAGHDNNRDSFMANLAETQNMDRLIGKVWFPELYYTQHETAPFPARIWIPPNPEPVNPNMHPLIFRWKNLIGAAMGQGFEAADKPGAISRTAFDLWYPGYSDGPSVEGHNIPSVLTETANYRYATPHYYRLYDFPKKYQDLTMGTFYPSPWQGGWWRFRDAVDYDLTASKAVLDVAARYRYEFLLYKYKMGRDVIDKFQKEPPYGWIVPAGQRDPNTTALMINRLLGYGVEIYRANRDFVYSGIPFRKGSFIIPTSQPFGMYAKNLLEKQRYPDLRKYGYLWQGISRELKWDGAPLAPYDGVGWTMPLQMGVQALRMENPLEVDWTPVTEKVMLNGEITGSGAQIVFSHSDNNSFIAVNKILKAGGKVSCALADFTLHGKRYPKGTFIAQAKNISAKAIQEVFAQSHVSAVRGKVQVKTKPVGKTRIALYKSWVANIDAGWISYLFDKYGFPYQWITNAEVKAGELRGRFDLIILPDQRASSIINGHPKGTMPPRYVGGISEDGVDNLREFVQEGGILVCNRNSCDLPVQQFKLPVKNILEKVKPDQFNCPGSLLKVKYNVEHPLAFGMKEKDVAYFSWGRVFERIPDSLLKKSNRQNAATKIIASYPDESLLLSGWMLGEKLIHNKAAIMDVQFGEGKIILFGFNVHNRAQAYATVKLLFNAMYCNGWQLKKIA